MMLEQSLRDAEYWHQRVRAETQAALACDDPHLAAIHVEIATRCLRMAQQELRSEPGREPA